MDSTPGTELGTAGPQQPSDVLSCREGLASGNGPQTGTPAAGSEPVTALEPDRRDPGETADSGGVDGAEEDDPIGPSTSQGRRPITITQTTSLTATVSKPSAASIGGFTASTDPGPTRTGPRTPVIRLSLRHSGAG